MQVWGEPLQREGPPEPEFAPPQDASAAPAPAPAALALAPVPSTPPDTTLQGTLARVADNSRFAQPEAATLRLAATGLTGAREDADAQQAVLHGAQQPTATQPVADANGRALGEEELRDQGGATLQEDRGQAAMDDQQGVAQQHLPAVNAAAAASAATSLPPLTRMVTRTMSRKRRSGLEAQGPDA